MLEQFFERCMTELCLSHGTYRSTLPDNELSDVARLCEVCKLSKECVGQHSSPCEGQEGHYLKRWGANTPCL